MLGSKCDATMGWTGDRTDSLKCFDDKMICVLKKEGNTVMQIKTFKNALIGATSFMIVFLQY